MRIYSMVRFLFLFLLFGTTAHTQVFDSLQASVGVQAQTSNKGYMPFWLVANKYGTVADRKSDIGAYVQLSNKNVIGKYAYTDDEGFESYKDLNLTYGLSVYNNNQLKKTFIGEAYAKLEYGNFSFRAGRFRETTGDVDAELSTGSLGVSANALPIPKVGLAFTDYTNFPFTNGWVQFKGSLAHGWMGDDSYIKNAYYHEKTLYLRFGGGPFKVYGGVQHFAVWGGNRGEQKLDNSMSGFWNVLFARNTVTPSSDNLAESHGGDQRGLFEGGAYWENDMVTLHAYLQKPFEGKQDIDLRNKSVLGGLQLSIKDEDIRLQKVLIEVISTKGINNYIPAQQRESAYNNNIYKTGWEYEDRVIGTPLFLNRQRASNYFSEIAPYDWNAADGAIPGNSNIVSNRVFGVHLAAAYGVSNALKGKTLVTATQNYGTLSISTPFAPKKNEFYALQEFSYELPHRNFTVKAGVAFDSGQLSNGLVVGGLFGIQWDITGRRDRDDFN